MSESEESSSNQQQPRPLPSVDNLSQKFEKLSIPSSFSIWPPTQRTREAVINRLVETLSQPSIISKRYGFLSHDEASAAARSIEDEAFAAASAGVTGSADLASVDDGIEALQAYSKEISKRMLGAVKSRGGGAAAAVTPEVASAPPNTSAVETAASETGDASEGLSSVDPESS